MRVTMLLADAAQEVNGKLYVLGGGWSVTGPDLPPMAIAIKLDVPWSAANAQHAVRPRPGRRGRPGGACGRQPAAGCGSRAASRSAGRRGSRRAATSTSRSSVTIPPFPVSTGRYSWRLTIDEESGEDWVRPFQVRARG